MCIQYFEQEVAIQPNYGSNMLVVQYLRLLWHVKDESLSLQSDTETDWKGQMKLDNLLVHHLFNRVECQVQYHTSPTHIIQCYRAGVGKLNNNTNSNYYYAFYL